MILVTVELLRHGDPSRRKRLGVARIANDGTGTLKIGNYSYKLWQRLPKKAWREGNIAGFPRQRLNAWDLLYRVLKHAVGSRWSQVV